MKRIEHSLLLASLVALALGACTMAGTRDDSTGISSTSDADYPVNQGSSASTGAAMTDPATQTDAMASSPNSTVTSIDIIPRQGDDATGAGTVAGAALGGTTTSGTPTDRVYRITLRMDNGEMQTVTQESTPAFAPGDRVRLSNGAVVP